MAYEYKINSMEVYKSSSLTPEIAADVMVYGEDGTMLKHQTVVLNAVELDKQIVTKDTLAQATAKVTALVEVVIPTKELDALDAEQKAKIVAWAEAAAILSKVQAKLGLSKEQVVAQKL